MIASRLESHVGELERALQDVREQAANVESWAQTLAPRLLLGGRLLTAGNGGSAAQAQHLSAELVGRFQGERLPLSSICLSSEPATVTALGNDYGFDRLFARQVAAHARPGDVLLCLSTSGASPNTLLACEEARDREVLTWALTGPAPNPLSRVCDDAICIEHPPATVQEAHLILVHMLCAAVDAVVREIA